MKLWFEYPNGRVHESELEAELELRPGMEIARYGRRWRVDRFVPADKYGREPHWRCEPIGTGPLDQL